MVALQLARRASSLVSACFAVCVLIRVARSQQSMCVTSEVDSCYSERKVICNNYTYVYVDRDCLSGTVLGISYENSMYIVSHGSSLPNYDDASFEVISLHLCHERALEVTISDLPCETECTSEKDDFLLNGFLFSCKDLPNVLSSGLTIMLFERTENPSCSHLKTKFVIIDTRGLKLIG